MMSFWYFIKMKVVSGFLFSLNENSSFSKKNKDVELNYNKIVSIRIELCLKKPEHQA